RRFHASLTCLNVYRLVPYADHGAWRGPSRSVQVADIVVEQFASPYPEPVEDALVEETVDAGLADEEVDEPLDPDDEGPVDAASLAELEGEVQQAAQLDEAFLQEGVLELL